MRHSPLLQLLILCLLDVAPASARDHRWSLERGTARTQAILRPRALRPPLGVQILLKLRNGESLRCVCCLCRTCRSIPTEPVVKHPVRALKGMRALRSFTVCVFSISIFLAGHGVAALSCYPSIHLNTRAWSRCTRYSSLEE
jgi:hypothetical protein